MSARPAASAGGSAIQDAIPILAKNPLLGAFGPSDWRLFAEHLELITFPADVVVVQESSEGQDMYFIIDGKARLRRAVIDLGVIGPGDHFGELALISRRMRAASVVTITPLVVARLSRARYDALAAADPALALRFTQALVGALGERLTEMTDSVGLLLRERSLPRHVMVDVTVAGAIHSVKTGTPARALLPAPAEESGAIVVAALMNQKAVSLSAPITSDATLSPLTVAHWEGKRVYRQSLGFLLLEAARRVDPGAVVRLGPSCGFGQRVDAALPPDITPERWVERVTAVMKDLISIDIAFHQEIWTVEEAHSHFEERGWRDAAMLLRAQREPTVPLASAGELYAFGLGPLLPSAGLIGAFPFRLEAAPGGFVLHYGDEQEVSPSEAPCPGEPGAALFGGGRKIALEEEPWLRTLGVTSVGAFNEACVVGNVSEIIRVSEGLHEKRIGQIADTIASRAGKLRVISIAGPSSSGKTTFIKRLTVQLLVNGIHPVGISLDDYYLDREKSPRAPTGEFDFEALEALDLPLMEQHIGRLLAGERVTTARYDFALGKSLKEGGPTITLGSSDVLMLEGIHGLNPRLLSTVLERSQVFRIFIQPSTALPFDRASRVSASDVRLLRRIVRDRHQRATDAATNILRWPSVRAGEREHIFPFLDQADAVFDSALVYEISVIKVFADRYLLEVPPEHPATVTAHRLRQLIDRFITIYPDHVPPTSILREFIGGSGFEY